LASGPRTCAPTRLIAAPNPTPVVNAQHAALKKDCGRWRGPGGPVRRRAWRWAAVRRWTRPRASPCWPPTPAAPTTRLSTNEFGVVENATRRRKVYIGHDTVRPRIAVARPGADHRRCQRRSQLILGAHLADQALTISETRLMRGVVLAAVLRPVMEFDADLARASYAAVADAMGMPLSWSSGSGFASRCANSDVRRTSRQPLSRLRSPPIHRDCRNRPRFFSVWVIPPRAVRLFGGIVAVRRVAGGLLSA
jgi:hypothetical protein